VLSVIELSRAAYRKMWNFAAKQRLDYSFIDDGMTLQQLFDADISGRDFPRGKPDPAIFLTAAPSSASPLRPASLLRTPPAGSKPPEPEALPRLGGPPRRPRLASGGERRSGRDPA
jgi:hypothetical protein